MSSSVTLSKLQKIFRDVHHQKDFIAVDSIDLEIKPGELVTLLGPSGCGKTTVLRMLAGFETPTSGQILVDGKDTTDLPPNRRNSAMVFQSYALFPHMNVLENITYGLKFRKLSAEERKTRLERILEAVSLKDYQMRRPHELSGGQQQRVALARALIIEPALLLFDEPLSNLDAKLREFMRNEIRSIQQKVGITSVYVTHDQSEAMAISDRVVVMNKGRIEQIGTPDMVYLKPATPFVADFMGAANFLKKAGSSEMLVIRPENVQIFSADHAKGLPGKIKEYHYLGPSHEYALVLETGETITARTEVIAGVRPFPVGTSVKAVFREDNVHTLRA